MRTGESRISTKWPHSQRMPSADNRECTLAVIEADNSHDTMTSATSRRSNVNTRYATTLFFIRFQVVYIQNMQLQGSYHQTGGIHATTVRKQFLN